MRAAVGLTLLPAFLLAQGFPWELSPRLPVRAPLVFVGAGVQAAYTPSLATLEVIEGEWSCATYRRGTGLGLSMGIHAEWWYAPTGALRLLLAAEYARLRLSTLAEPLPLSDGRMLQTEYQLRYGLWTTRVEALWKQRLWRWLWVGASLWGALQWRSAEEQWEVVLAPADYFFRTLPPARERRLTSARSVALRPYGFGIRLRLGYDLMLARHHPLYAAPALVVGTALTSLSTTAAWTRWELGIEIPLLRGLP
ncbi:hypothetical protein HRbin21_00639 [bacterium HR21]|nr:hypothetical protein HRbin21_00639 [bacterium HR21]